MPQFTNRSTIKNIQHGDLHRKEFLSHATYFADSGRLKKVHNIRGIKNQIPLKWYEKNKPFSSYRKRFSKGGNGKYRAVENLQEIGSLTIDIDWNRPEPLYFQNLLAHCTTMGIPKPNYVIKTSPDKWHYQLIWQFPHVKKDKLKWWQKVAEALAEVFKPFDADISTTVDPTKLTRNPHYQCADIIYNSEHDLTLSELYNSLKAIGFIKLNPPGSRIRRARQTSFSHSLAKIETFFQAQGTFKGTHSRIYSSLGIPKATYYVLLKALKRAGKLQIQTIRNGKTWVSEITYFHGLRKEPFNRGGAFFYSNLLSCFHSGGVCCGFRNKVVFALSLFLKIGGLSERGILERLGKGLEICKGYGCGFDGNEVKVTVQSACRERYNYLISANKLREWGVFEALLGDDLNSQKVNLDREHSEACDCVPCCENVVFPVLLNPSVHSDFIF